MPGDEWTKYTDHDIDELTSFVNKYHAEFSDHHAATSKARDVLRESWVGDGFESFSGRVDELTGQLNEIMCTLSQSGKDVRLAYEAIQGADKTVAGFYPV